MRSCKPGGRGPNGSPVPLNPLVRHGLTRDQTFTGHDRITCLCGRTIVRQPWMTDGVWNSRVRVFECDNHVDPNTRHDRPAVSVGSDRSAS